MTEYTRRRIIDDPETFTAPIGPFPNGKFGIYIGSLDKTPSGCLRPRVLLTSDGVCDTAEDAKSQGNRILSEIRRNKSISSS